MLLLNIVKGISFFLISGIILLLVLTLFSNGIPNAQTPCPAGKFPQTDSNGNPLIDPHTNQTICVSGS